MIDLSYDFIVTLQNEVLRRFGVNQLLPGHCKFLSQAILDATGKLISETTLKRFFGFALAQHSFSRYTLNTLAQYCQYKDWDDFQTHYYRRTASTDTAEQPADQEKWTEIRAKANAVSHYTLMTLKNRSGIPFLHTVPRQYCLSHVERFLESNCVATVFIAPSGWGKSLALVHTAEHFWLGKDAAHKKDICWFIHAHAAGNLLLKGFSLSSWLDNQLHLGNGETFRDYFSHYFEEKGGRLVLVIDGFDEIALGADKLKLLYTKLEDFVYSNGLHPWLKVILSIRSSTWGEVFQQAQQYPAFRRYWYLGQEMDEECNINIPQLSEQDVKTVLYNCRFEPATVRTFSDGFLQKLRHPYYLQLFCQLNESPEQTFVDENLSLFEITSRFIQNRVFNSSSNSFKVQIIYKLLELLDMGRNGQYADKSILLNKNADLFPAYKELIADNILVEENLSQEIMFHVKVRFAHNFLLEYFTAMHFILENNMQISEEMLQRVVNYFPQSPFRIAVFKWLLRYAITQQNIIGIQQIFVLPLMVVEKANLLEYTVLHYQHEDNKHAMLKNIFPPEYFRKHPISSFISDDFVHFKKRKVLNSLMGLAEASDDKLKIKSNLFVMALIQLDAEQCEIELNNIKKICASEPSMSELWLTPYEVFLFIYEYLKFGICNEEVKEKVCNYARHWSFSAKKPFSVPEEIVYRAMCYIFLLLGDNEQMLHFTQRLFQHYPSILFSKTDPFRLMMLCWKAQAHMATGNLAPAKRISSHVEKILKQYYSADFFNAKLVDILHKIIYAQICFHEKDYSKAIRISETAMDSAQRLDFKLFSLKNFATLHKIYHQLEMDKQKRDALQKVEIIREGTTFKQAVNYLVGNF
ncbi:hypothetical protein MKQ70_26340 [Chitinophaga sedimenti]|uniref:hypothetical protein n=1 Tax=Chitinophaga sedimenti TaxID=2033606 RepID=UPI002003A487|nr:hypothetical protein [Chitinophaga sedimenti]MCK7558330.1 hypothetical protein [Chitinophaga sedimenti]